MTELPADAAQTDEAVTESPVTAEPKPPVAKTSVAKAKKTARRRSRAPELEAVEPRRAAATPCEPAEAFDLGTPELYLNRELT